MRVKVKLKTTGIYIQQKNNIIKRFETFELQPKLLSMYSILTMVFQAPKRTFIVPSGARMDISEVFLHG